MDRSISNKNGEVSLFSQRELNSLLVFHKTQYMPRVATLLKDIGALHPRRVECESHAQTLSEGERVHINLLLPHQAQYRNSYVEFYSSPTESSKKLHTGPIGVVFSGGPAPGGNNILSGLFDALTEIKSEGSSVSLIGFLNGPKGLIENRYKALDKEIIDAIRNRGGFECIGSGRDKIELESDKERVISTIVQHNLSGLIIIGGDDSNTNASFIAEALSQKGIESCPVIGVPKTIDGDLQSTFIPISFGFDTATKVYSSLISNIARDCLSTKKYFYFIRLMGRSASHITLECALSIRPNLAFISEEVMERGRTLKDVVQEIVEMIAQRMKSGKNYGITLIPEGLIECLSDVRALLAELNWLLSDKHPLHHEIIQCVTSKERLKYVLDHLSDGARSTLSLFPDFLEVQLVEERDPHGNVQVSKIETERLLEKLVFAELSSAYPDLSKKYSSQTAFYGYEGRCADPSHFDCAYCYNLGRLAVAALKYGLNGHILALKDLHLPPELWTPVAAPLIDLLHFEERGGKTKAVIKKSLVELNGPLFSLFKNMRTEWVLSDSYQFTLPPQFWGPEEIVDAPCLTVMASKEKSPVLSAPQSCF